MKLFFCQPDSQNRLLCQQRNIVEDDAIYLSYIRLFEKKSHKHTLKIYLLEKIYNKLKKNFTTLTDEDFKELMLIIKEIYKLLPRGKRDYLLDKVNLLLQNREFNIDLFEGLLLENGAVFLFDSSSETIQYIKYILRYENGNL